MTASSSPPATPASPPAPAAPVKPATPAPPTAPAPPPRSGVIDDQGVVRREAVRALRWTSRGRTKVLADVDCGEVNLTGGAVIGGTLTADSVRSDGDLDVGGAVQVTGSLHSSGSLRTRGPFRVGAADLRGRTRLDGAAHVDRGVTVHGLFVAPSVQAVEFSLDGVAEIEGALEAEKVAAHFRGSGRIGRIRAKSVALRLRPPNPVEVMLGRAVAFPVERIEADTVEVEGVDVRFLRAREIVLGRGAHVTELEGHIVRRHGSARVGPESKSPRPYGLTP